MRVWLASMNVRVTNCTSGDRTIDYHAEMGNVKAGGLSKFVICWLCLVTAGCAAAYKPALRFDNRGLTEELILKADCVLIGWIDPAKNIRGEKRSVDGQVLRLVRVQVDGAMRVLGHCRLGVSTHTEFQYYEQENLAAGPPAGVIQGLGLIPLRWEADTLRSMVDIRRPTFPVSDHILRYKGSAGRSDEAKLADMLLTPPPEGSRSWIWVEQSACLAAELVGPAETVIRLRAVATQTGPVGLDAAEALAKLFPGHGEAYLRGRSEKATREHFHERLAVELQVAREALAADDFALLTIRGSKHRTDILLYLMTYDDSTIRAKARTRLERLLN